MNLTGGEAGEIEGAPGPERDITGEGEAMGGGEAGAQTCEAAGSAGDSDGGEFADGDLRFGEETFDEGEEFSFLSALGRFAAREDFTPIAVLTAPLIVEGDTESDLTEPPGGFNCKDWCEDGGKNWRESWVKS